MPPGLKLNAVAFVSAQNHPIFIRTFTKDDVPIKYHYIAHTSLDVVEERIAAVGKECECYLGLLFTMEDVAVYGYVTPLKVKIIVALPLSDAVVKNAEIMMVFKAFHMAYYSSVSNPFLTLVKSGDVASDQPPVLAVGSTKWKAFRRRVDEISRVIGNPNHISS